MKNHRQLVPHNPSTGHYGDCHRTAIAALLDLEPYEVPHFFNYDTEKDNGARGHREAQEWAAELGLRFISILFPGAFSTVGDVLRTVEAINPDLGYLLGGSASNGEGHTVAVKAGAIACDPSGMGIAGPLEDGHYWITFVGKDV